MNPNLTVVIPCHNRREALRSTLGALARQSGEAGRFEVIVVDQASTDGSREMVRNFLDIDHLRLLSQDAVLGPSAARNAGVAAASGPVILFLDADLLPEPNLVEAHLTLHAAYPGALSCGRVLPYFAAYRSFVERSANPDAGLDRGVRPGVVPFYQAFSGNLSIRPDAFQQVGPFDTSLRSYEDIDFAYRAHRQGMLILNCPGAVAYHNHPRTLHQRREQARSYDRMVPILLARYPELKGNLPFARDFETIDLRRDSTAGVYRKLRVRLLAAAPVQGAMFEVLKMLDRYQRWPRLAKVIYWRWIAGNHYLGFREGTALLQTDSSTNDRSEGSA